MSFWRNNTRFSYTIFAVSYIALSALILAVSYRIFLIYELREIYPELRLGIFSLIRQSAPTDIALAFTLSIPIIFIIFLENKIHRRIIITSVLILLISYGTLLAGSLLFVTIFESPFQTSFFGQSLGTFQNAMVTSTISELTLIPFRKSIPILALTFFTALGFAFLKKISEKKIGRFFLWSTITTFFAFILVGALSPNKPTGGGKKIKFEFSTIFTNPLSELSAHFFRKDPSTHTLEKDETSFVSVKTKKVSPLSRYNTDSPFNRRFFPRIPFERGMHYNIVFYFLESTSAQYRNLQYKGQDVMPNLKKVWKHGFAAERHYAQFPLSINTFYTVLTSAYQYPDKNFLPCSQPQIPLTTIYETLKEAGFYNAIFHGSSLDNFCRRDFLRNRQVDVQLGFTELDHKEFPPIDPTWQADDRVMVKPFINFMKQKTKHPKFAVVLPISPHHPYLVPEEKFNITKTELLQNTGRKEQYWLQYINSLYFSDYVFGEFMAALEKNNLLKNTVVFVFADHGEAFYQHSGNYLHSLFIYEENVHVPFAILNPQIFSKGIRYDGISRMVDIAPTALDILGIKPPKHYQGISLLSAHREQYALLHAQWADDIIGIIDGQTKYTYRVNDSFEELFNIKEDPYEKNNLANEDRTTANKYRSLVLKGRHASQNFYRAVYKGNLK